MGKLGALNWKLVGAFLVVGSNFFDLLNAQDPYSVCTSKQTCAECIKEPDCGWCSKSDFHGADKQPLARCNTTEGHVALGGFACDLSFYYNPDNTITLTKDFPISNDKKSAIPFRPQEVEVKLRHRTPFNFTIHYEDTQSYPLDLYFLMDLTVSMRDDRDTVARLGEVLANKLSNVTSAYRQGFGSFIDKEAMPFVTVVPGRVENNRKCAEVAGAPCTTPYGFRNHIQLSNDWKKFNESVSGARLAPSLDNPDGGLDGLIQTIVCTDAIGWVPGSRKLVVYASDSPYHIAGDGKLGGILRPNDGQCHLNASGYYSHSTEFDYPSIAQLNQISRQNNITVIFAVAASQYDTYYKLASRIENAKVGNVTEDSSNIVDLVEEEYRRILTSVEMSSNLPTYVRVRYFSKCGDETQEEIETSNCTIPNEGSPVSFTISLELLECPTNKEDWKQTYRIYRKGIPYGIIVKLSLLCGDCPCETSDVTTKSQKCSGVGTERCGLCDCEENYFGEYCECSVKGEIPEDKTKACIAPNSTDLCSQRGECLCNECVCNKAPEPNQKYTGKYCECDNFSCERSQGQLCSGQGECDCGECKCSPGWTGKDCSCSTSEATCKVPGEQEICSGHGECICGSCKCEGKYSGSYCQKCKHESCPNRCDELAPCVQCKIHGTGLDPSDCEVKCSSVPISTVEALEYDFDSDENICVHEDETDNCKYHFAYGLNPGKVLYVKALEKKECPFKAPVFVIVGGTALLMLLIGIITFLVWKTFIVIKDRREYAKFIEETRAQRFGATTNPLYDNPIGHYENPMYGKRID